MGGGTVSPQIFPWGGGLHISKQSGKWIHGLPHCGISLIFTLHFKTSCAFITGELVKLFSPLDGILEGFYHRILSQVSNLPEGILASAKCTNDLSGFLDLLELLVASRRQTAVSFTCQRMLFLNAEDVLSLTTSPVPTFIKKKSIVLLKRCVLCKAGEDLVTGKGSPSFLRGPHLDEDRVAFSNAVLQLVDSGWLNRLLVGEKVARFGGSRVRPELDIRSGPDDVFLTGLSLILLKALETRVQKSTSEFEAQGNLILKACLVGRGGE